LEKNKIITMEEFRDGTRDQFINENGNGALKTFKTIVLINGGSASASEILSGALHDNRDVRLVGEKVSARFSARAGEIQQWIFAKDNSG